MDDSDLRKIIHKRVKSMPDIKKIMSVLKEQMGRDEMVENDHYSIRYGSGLVYGGKEYLVLEAKAHEYVNQKEIADVSEKTLDATVKILAKEYNLVKPFLKLKPHKKPKSWWDSWFSNDS